MAIGQADFAASVERFAKMAGERADRAAFEIANAVAERVKELTPVRTGNLRAGWTVVSTEEAKRNESLGAFLAGSAGDMGTAWLAKRQLQKSGMSAIRAERAGGIAGAAAGAVISYATGESTATEAVASAAGQVTGTAIGTAIGTAAAGPVGGAVGGFIGGTIGSSAGFYGTQAVSAVVSPPRSWTVINNVGYAPFVEYGHQIKLKDGGTKDVPGRLMLTQTVAELPRIAATVMSQMGVR